MPDNKPLEIKYDEPVMGTPPTSINLEQVYGQIPHVSAVPTWVPKKFQDNFAVYVNGSTRRFYVYDFTGKTWRFAALT